MRPDAATAVVFLLNLIITTNKLFQNQV